MKKLGLIIALVLTLPLIEANTISSAELNKLVNYYEKKVVADLKKENAPREKYFEWSMKAANEFYLYKEFQLAKKYFQMSIDEKTTQSKLPAFIGLLGVSLSLRDKSSGVKLVTQLEKYLKENVDQKAQMPEGLLEYYKVKFSTIPTNEVLSKAEQDSLNKAGRFNYDIMWHDIEVYLITKKTKEAAELLKGVDLTRSPINEQIIYDLTMTLSLDPNYKDQKNLLCKRQLLLYPESLATSYSMNICAILNDLAQGKKPDKSNFDKVSQILKTQYPDKLYLAQVIKDKFWP